MKQSPIQSLAILGALTFAVPAHAAFQTMAGGYAKTYGSYYIGGFLPPITIGQNNQDEFNWVNGSGQSVGLSAAGSQTTPQLIRPTNSTTDLPISWFSQAQSGMSGSATPGKLHASASASALMNPTTQSLIYWDNVKNEAGAYTAVNPLHAFAEAQVQVGWQDTITITSDTLPVGSWVNVELKAVLDSSISNPNNTPNNGLSTTFSATSNSTSTSFQVIGTSNSNTASKSRVWSFKVGETVTLKATMVVAAFARAGYNIDPLVSGVIVPNDMVSVDASNTGHYYFDIQSGVNASVVSESGYNYSVTAPVPEPAGLGVALLAGGVALTSRRRRPTVA